MMVDVAGLHEALLGVPLTAATAFPIYSAVGLLPDGEFEIPDPLKSSPSHMSDHEDLGSNSKVPGPAQFEASLTQAPAEPLGSQQSTPLHS